jgi:hypothetical protein
MSDALDWEAPTTEQTEFKKLEPGIYPFTVVDFEKGRWEGENPCNTAGFHVKVHGRTIRDLYFLTQSSVHKLQKTLKALGRLDTTKSLLQNCEGAVGVCGECKVDIEPSKKLDENGAPYMNERIREYKCDAMPATVKVSDTQPDW